MERGKYMVEVGLGGGDGLDGSVGEGAPGVKGGYKSPLPP
jgi:hypothetical protein